MFDEDVLLILVHSYVRRERARSILISRGRVAFIGSRLVGREICILIGFYFYTSVRLERTIPVAYAIAGNTCLL